MGTSSFNKFEFKGSGSEYFKIWIANISLTFLTFGIYFPWARVRTRRYLYNHTYLAGHNFDYIADPKKLLRGYAIALFFFVVYAFSELLSFWITIPMLILWFIAYPWIIFKSARFNLSHTTYRHIRFSFRGGLKSAYKVFLFLPMLILPTLGLILPYFDYKRKQYFYQNLSYGNLKARFLGSTRFFYLSYLVFFPVLAGLIIFISARTKIYESNKGLAVLLIFFFILAFILAIQTIKVMILNHCIRSLRIDTEQNGVVKFYSQIEILKYLYIVTTNYLLTVITLGLFIPWAKIRLLKYKVSCIVAYGVKHFDDVIADVKTETSTIGEAASDIFEIEFGL